MQVECMLSARDIGFVREGLRVHYQIDALPFQEWGAAEGVIQMVAKNITVQEQTNNQATLFKVIGTLPALMLHSTRQQKSAAVNVGMTCRASVIITEKRVLSMLWDKTALYFVL